MRKHIWIESWQQVKFAIGLEIGVDISQEEADELMKLEAEGDDFQQDTEEWYKLNEYLTPDCICDWGDHEYVEIYIEEDVRKW